MERVMTDASGTCHCGKRVYVHTALDGFTRGLCHRCDEVRCDVSPGACVQVDTYQLAQDDPVARVVLAALHEQDARTYNGNSGDSGRLALDTADRIRQIMAALQGDAQ